VPKEAEVLTINALPPHGAYRPTSATRQASWVLAALTLSATACTTEYVTVVERDDVCEADMSCGLLAHWKLDDGAGDTADDSAYQMDHPGTLVGDNPPEWIAGQVGGALRFAGGNRVEITGSANHRHWHFAEQYKSVSFWFRWRPADSVGAGYMIGKFQGGTPGTGWYFRVGAEDKLTFNHRRAAGGSRTVASTTVITTEAWYHVVFTLTDGGLANLYINGDLEDTNTSFDDLNNNTNKTIGIGAARGDTSTNTFGGDIDDVRFYAHPLSRLEIDMLYQCGLAGAC
jgi:hypothetical protein